jgi:hypothetical protein
VTRRSANESEPKSDAKSKLSFVEFQGGTEAYMSPELVADHKVNSNNIVYSLVYKAMRCIRLWCHIT